jgi:septal ring factor EnvC (AmiA/AmiB activator)
MWSKPSALLFLVALLLPGSLFSQTLTVDKKDLTDLKAILQQSRANLLTVKSELTDSMKISEGLKLRLSMSQTEIENLKKALKESLSASENLAQMLGESKQDLQTLREQLIESEKIQTRALKSYHESLIKTGAVCIGAGLIVGFIAGVVLVR